MTTQTNRIDRRFAELARTGRTGLIPYVTAGHPNPESTVPVLHALVEAGADLVELGVPFSDVMADGPVIQDACQVALEHGTSMDRVFEMVRAFRETDRSTPLILMGYMNPIERRGFSTFAEQAAAAGADGVLIVDCPVDESEETTEAFRAQNLHQIFLVAPTTTESRLKHLTPAAGGFVYYVSLKGVTGSASLDAGSLKPPIARLRAASKLPIAVGFGIATAEQARDVAEVADAVVIGSALVRRLADAGSPDEAVAVASGFLEPIRAAMDAGAEVAASAEGAVNA